MFYAATKRSQKSSSVARSTVLRHEEQKSSSVARNTVLRYGQHSPVSHVNNETILYREHEIHISSPGHRRGFVGVGFFQAFPFFRLLVEVAMGRFTVSAFLPHVVLPRGMFVR